MTFFTDVNPDALSVSPESAALPSSLRATQYLTVLPDVPALVLISLGLLVVGGTLFVLRYAPQRHPSEGGAQLRQKLTGFWEMLPLYVWAAFCVVPPVLFLLGVIR